MTPAQKYECDNGKKKKEELVPEQKKIGIMYRRNWRALMTAAIRIR